MLSKCYIGVNIKPIIDQKYNKTVYKALFFWEQHLMTSTQFMNDNIITSNFYYNRGYFTYDEFCDCLSENTK